MMGFSLADIYSSIERIENVIPVESLSKRLRFGEHKSVFKSTGHDFDQIKEYDPEDDSIFEILWNSIGTDGKLYVRKAIATKEFPAVILGDLSTSMTFGVDYRCKERMFLETMGNIGMTCSHGQDPMGFIGFAEDILFDEQPRLGQDHVDYLIEEVYKFFQAISSDGKGKLDRKKTDFDKAFRFFSERYANNQCFVVAISDFIGVEEFANSQILKDVANQHEVVFIFLDDPEEFKFSGPGYIKMENMETGEQISVSRRMSSNFIRNRRKNIREELRNIGVDSMVLEYGKHFQRLHRFFLARQESFRG